MFKADSRFALSQWETTLLCYDVSHRYTSPWLKESKLSICCLPEHTLDQLYREQSLNNIEEHNGDLTFDMRHKLTVVVVCQQTMLGYNNMYAKTHLCTARKSNPTPLLLILKYVGNKWIYMDLISKASQIGTQPRRGQDKNQENQHTVTKSNQFWRWPRYTSMPVCRPFLPCIL